MMQVFQTESNSLILHDLWIQLLFLNLPVYTLLFIFPNTLIFVPFCFIETPFILLDVIWVWAVGLFTTQDFLCFISVQAFVWAANVTRRWVLVHVVSADGQVCVDRPLLRLKVCYLHVYTCWTAWGDCNTLFVPNNVRHRHQGNKRLTAMSANRCLTLFSRLHRHINPRTARVSAGSCHVSSGSVLLHREQQCGSVVCSRSVSSNSSSAKPPDTSLFVPVSLKTDSPGDGGVGAELTQPLDKSEYIHPSLSVGSHPNDLWVI